MNERNDLEKASLNRSVLRALLRTEVLVALPTLVISIALAYFSFVQADASRKMQESGTWPFISYGTGNSSPNGKDVISFSISNDGVGPARLKEMELVYEGKPVADLRQFILACCAVAANGIKDLSFATNAVDGVLRPGEERNFISFAKTHDNAALWDRLDGERWKVVVHSCYCSIFDDCWVLDSRKEDPDQVKACPANWTKFEPVPGERPGSVAKPQ
ncbi:MAG TPA: hypothetical protein VFW39_06940 [Sphingomicrobium sp.]|nr:hypothetical protein [Sphingomicrobium sp.]